MVAASSARMPSMRASRTSSAIARDSLALSWAARCDSVAALPRRAVGDQGGRVVRGTTGGIGGRLRFRQRRGGLARTVAGLRRLADGPVSDAPPLTRSRRAPTRTGRRGRGRLPPPCPRRPRPCADHCPAWSSRPRLTRCSSAAARRRRGVGVGGVSGLVRDAGPGRHFGPLRLPGRRCAAPVGHVQHGRDHGGAVGLVRLGPQPLDAGCLASGAPRACAGRRGRRRWRSASCPAASCAARFSSRSRLRSAVRRAAASRATAASAASRVAQADLPGDRVARPLRPIGRGAGWLRPSRAPGPRPPGRSGPPAG